MGVKAEGLPGFAIVNDSEKKCPHPWDTHYQFLMKTLLSKRPRARSAAERQVSNAHERDLVTNQNV